MTAEPMALTPGDVGVDLTQHPWAGPEKKPLPEVEPPMHRPSCTRRHTYSAGDVPMGTLVRDGATWYVEMKTCRPDQMILRFQVADLRYWIERLEEMRLEVETQLMG